MGGGELGPRRGEQVREGSGRHTGDLPGLLLGESEVVDEHVCRPLTGAQRRAITEIEADLAAVASEIDGLQQESAAVSPQEKKQPKRLPLPANLPRREIRHEPESSTCRCGCQMKRIGEDVAEKLDYEPGVFTVERHIRGKWVCKCCEKITQAPVAPHVIDKGLPTSALLAQVLVAKYLDHLPLYRLERIAARDGVTLSRSTLAEWVGRIGVALQPLADATTVSVAATGGTFDLDAAEREHVAAAQEARAALIESFGRPPEERSEGITKRIGWACEPLVEYQKEGLRLFRDMEASFRAQVSELVGTINKQVQETAAQPIELGSAPAHLRAEHQEVLGQGIDSPAQKIKEVQESPKAEDKIGRNDPCYCGSGKKYKKCHG